MNRHQILERTNEVRAELNRASALNDAIDFHLARYEVDRAGMVAAEAKRRIERAEEMRKELEQQV